MIKHNKIITNICRNTCINSKASINHPYYLSNIEAENSKSILNGSRVENIFNLSMYTLCIVLARTVHRVFYYVDKLRVMQDSNCIFIFAYVRQTYN